MIPLGAIGVLGGISGLGQDVQAGEEAQALITVEVANMTTPLLIQEFQGQQAQQGAGGRYSLAIPVFPTMSLVETDIKG